MEKFVDCILSLLAPMSREEKRLERIWERRLFIIQKKMKDAKTRK